MKLSIENLKKFTFFENCSDKELNEVFKNINVLSLKTNETVCSENDIAHSMFFIAEGGVTISKSSVDLANLKEGEYFGEMSLLDKKQNRRSATAITSGESVIFEISKEKFLNLVNNGSHILSDVVMTLDKRLRKDNQVVVDQFLELQRNYLELKETNDRLLKTDKLASIGILTSSIAHEINHPLSVISGLLQIMQNEFMKKEKDEQFFIGLFNKLNKATEGLKKIVLGVKSYVHFNDELSEIDLNSAIQGSIDLVSFLYKSENIDFVTSFDQTTPKILGNIGHIQQIMVNFLSNSKDAFQDDQKEKVINISTNCKDAYVEMKVVDNGCGIPEDKLVKIFDKFYTTKPIGQGTGLGLDIIKSIVDKMGAKIRVDSTLGTGTTFTIKCEIIT